MENMYVQFDDMVYQQKVGIPMGTKCAPLIADLFLYCYERNFMSDLHKSKRHDLIDIFNDTSRYLDDIFTIDNPEFEKYIPDIYLTELPLNKANTSDKETSFLDLIIKRSVMITQEMCPITAKISTHKLLRKCIYLLFVWLAIIGFRQNYFYILPHFGDFGAKMSFFHYIINQKRNNFIKHCSPPCTKKPLISEMCIYIKSSLCKWGFGTRGWGNDVL